MPAYRCLNQKCWDDPDGKPGFDFYTDEKVGRCPRCGLASDDPRVGHLVTKLTVIHFDPPHPVVAGMGMGFPLCEPGVKAVDLWRRKKEQFTGEPSLVSCAKCLQHRDFPKEWTEMDLARVPDWKLKYLS